MFWLKNVSNNNLAGYEAIDYNAANWVSTIDSIKRSGANVVYFAGYGFIASNFLKQLRAAGNKSIFVGGTSLYVDPEFKFQNGDVADGIRVVGLPSLSQLNPVMAEDFKKKIGSDPGIYSVPTIDATNVFLNGFAAGVNTRYSMLEYISRYKGLGLQGTEISFDLFGDLNGNGFVGYEYVNGQYKQFINKF
jgi:ABC-type branched-subunit amino acid transport system substrate-binding protein